MMVDLFMYREPEEAETASRSSRWPLLMTPLSYSRIQVLLIRPSDASQQITLMRHQATQLMLPTQY